MLVRVLYAWDGNQKPYAPNTIMEMDDDVARERMQAGHVEAISKSDARRVYGYRPGGPVEPETASDEGTGDDAGDDGADDEGGQVDAPPTDEAPAGTDTPLSDMTRAELNALASQLGIEQPERLANRGEVMAAITGLRAATADDAESVEE